MRRHRLLVTLLTAFSMAAMLLSGLAALPPQTSGDVSALPKPTVEVVESEDDVLEDDIVLLARRRKHVRFKLMPVVDFFVRVNINSNLKGKKSYKVLFCGSGSW